MQNKTFTRQQLYNLVWSKPVTHIAKEYGCSDNDIREICKKHTIPLPKNGYWSKLKHKKKVVTEKLPALDNSPEISLDKSGTILLKDNNVLSEIALKKKEIEGSKDLSYTVPIKLSKPHRFTIATKEYHKELKVVRKRGGWSNEISITDTLSISVSDTLFARGLLFMDTLIKILVKRGFEVTANDKTEATIRGQSYSIRMTEKNRRVQRETNNSWQSFDLEPTGNLCLKIDTLYPIKEWCDSKSKTLENKLSDILAWLEIRAKKDEEEGIAREIWHKERERTLKKEKELQLLRDNELSNFQNLFDTATRWHKSQYLRNYIKKFEASAIKANTLDSDQKEWIQWAQEKADWYDPFIEKEVELLDDIDRESLKRKNGGYY